MPDPFADLPRTPETHFQLCSYATVTHVLLSLAQSLGSLEDGLREFPFLSGYQRELTARGLAWSNAAQADEWWQATLAQWEDGFEAHLPLRALREASGLTHEALALFISIGLIEEDARFGLLFESLQGLGRSRPSAGLLAAWWPNTARADLRLFSRLGLVQAANPEAPRSEQMLHVPALIWDTLRGETHTNLTPWARYYPATELCSTGDLISSPEVESTIGSLPDLLRTGSVQAVVVRGPQHNGRRTLLGALAREQGRGSVIIDDAGALNDERVCLAGSLATLLHALPVLVYYLTPGESRQVPELAGCDTPLGIVLGLTGGLTGRAIEQAVTLTLEMPTREQRVKHWQHAARSHPIEDLEQVAERYRLTSGNLYRAATLASAQAALTGRTAITSADIQIACRSLHRQALETLTTRLEVFGDWSYLAVGEGTRRDLFELEARCLQRERLPSAVGAAFGPTVNAGVRVLLTGPSGTGKTLAARVLAAQLQMDIYRLDLSAVVNKYIGETEKNLNQVFARAEELDVILLIDEGDSILAQRTSLNNSNDRYANLETNFLLQRLETYSGIVIITTNSSEHIDRAFQRRMDVVIDFRPPEAAERWQIWQLHLPQFHAVEERFLNEVVTRCMLTGGQIRNAALHATLLAVNNGGCVTTEYLEEAVKREYHQSGAVCPLRAPRIPRN